MMDAGQMAPQEKRPYFMATVDILSLALSLL